MQDKQERSDSRTGMTPRQRAEEALRIWGMIRKLDFSELPKKDQDFLQGMYARLTKYSIYTEVSAEQLFWLRDIKDRIME